MTRTSEPEDEREEALSEAPWNQEEEDEDAAWKERRYWRARADPFVTRLHVLARRGED